MKKISVSFFNPFEKCSFNELPISKRWCNDNIILAGLWFGTQKPNMLTFLKPFVMNSIKELIPSLKFSDIQPSKKVGIRAQLFDQVNKKLVKDLLILHGRNSTHVINAISPAFTSSFEFADLIITEIIKNGYEKKS